MAENQLDTTHNVNTRKKCFCLHPVTIVNPALVSFVLSTNKVYAHNKNGLLPFQYGLPLNTTTKILKDTLLSRLRKFVKQNKIDYFMDSDGCIMDAQIDVPCNHCILCLERKKNSFAAKCIMETQSHDFLPVFVTLTYRDQCYPSTGLCYKDVQDFLKRLRITLHRKFKLSVNLKYACGCEYGSKTNRAHYHLLLWGLPRQHPRLKALHQVYELLADSWQNGFVYVKQCKDSNASFYVAKYMSKDSIIPNGYEQPHHRSSINLGVDFVESRCRKFLYEHPEKIDFSYCDRFTGQVSNIPLVKYFIDKIFPKYSSVPVEYRNALRDYHTAIEFGTTLDVSMMSLNLPLLDTDIDHFRDSISVPDKFCTALSTLNKINFKKYPDFAAAKSCRDRFYFSVFSNLGDVDLEHQAYIIEKRLKIQKDKEVF